MDRIPTTASLEHDLQRRVFAGSHIEETHVIIGPAVTGADGEVLASASLGTLGGSGDGLPFFGSFSWKGRSIIIDER